MAMSQARLRAIAAEEKAAKNAKRLRWLAIISVAAIIAVAGWASYWHIVAVCIRYGEDSTTAHLMPALIDGLMTVTGIAIIASRSREFTTAKMFFIFGLACSLGANVLAARPSLIGYVLAGIPSIALLGGTHELLKLFVPAPKRRRRRRVRKPVAEVSMQPSKVRRFPRLNDLVVGVRS